MQKAILMGVTTLFNKIHQILQNVRCVIGMDMVYPEV